MDQGRADIFEIVRDAEAGVLGERASVLDMPDVDCTNAPSRVSHRRTIHRRCSKIFCTTSHTVADNKLCGIYLQNGVTAAMDGV